MAAECRTGRYLTAYVDGELSARMRRRVEKHLGACESCSRELDSIVATSKLLRDARPPSVPEARWRVFRAELSRSLDRVDRETARPGARSLGELVFGFDRRRVLAIAGVCAVAALAAIVLGPAGQVFMRTGVGGGNECMVDSIESYASGYTPMFFTSEDPDMTVIWVFAEDTEAVNGDGAPGAPSGQTLSPQSPS